MYNLQSLDLSYNQLTSFYGAGMSNLSNLYLGYNQLSSFDGSSMYNLQYLYLNSNQLRSFDATGMTNLYQIDLSSNLLYSLSPSISSTNIQYQWAAYFDYNCLSRSYMDSLGVSSWLDSHTYGWENQNSSCPVGHPVCFDVTDVSFDECEALMSIYDNNGGHGWDEQTNWGASTTVGDWYGVTVSGGHVI